MMTARADSDSLPHHIDGLAEVIDSYDGVILDLWGVVHNGVAPFSRTVATLEKLRDANKDVWLLSNAPRRVDVVAAHLRGMGIGPDLYTGLLTSGEASHIALRDELIAVWGPRCYLLGHAYGEDLLQGLPCTIAETIAEADFVLATSVPGDTLEDNIGVLQQARARNLPMLCANPDRVVHVGSALLLCPGTLADYYEGLGGAVAWFGKPYAAVYDDVLARMPSRRVLAVGDGMATDVKGAVAAGIDVALVTAGIHRESLFGGQAGAGEIAPALRIAENRLRSLIAAEGVKSSFIINGLY